MILGLVAVTAPLFQGCTTTGDAASARAVKPLPRLPYVKITELETPRQRPFLKAEPMPPPPPPLPPKAVAASATAASAEKDGWMQPVWFGTNRKPEVVNNRLTYTSIRDDRTHYGRADVWVPKAHRRGETGRPFWRRWLDLDFEGDDYLVAQEPKSLQRDPFYVEIQKAVSDGGQSQALVFIHGFNVEFEEAAIRAAQIGWDLKVPGPTAFFSWPSRGKVLPDDYLEDGKMIERSKTALVEFLVEFARNSGAKNINIIAHSMGNRGLLQALQHIAADAQLRESVKFNQIILAAPDITKKVFEQAAQVYAQLSTRTTLYTSKRDLALFAAPNFDQPGVRAGYFEPYTVAEGVNTIAVPNFNVDLLGHSDFAQADALLYDIEALCKHNEDPGSRSRIDRFEADGKQLWRLRR
jgi:esterase/lipase superfamily enzyme